MGMTFGEAVKRRREELGLTQGELGYRLERDSTRVSKVESGHTFRRLPKANEFRAWADALEINPAVILEQMGYVGDTAILDDPERKPELLFTRIADQVRDSGMDCHVQEVIADAIKHARRLYDLQAKHRSATTA